MKESVIFKFVGEPIRKTFNSIEDAEDHVKNKLPSNGKEWIIEEIHTKVIKHKIKSKRELINNKEITRKIVDYFIEHATVKNVDFDGNEMFFINPDHRDFRFHAQLYSFLCTEKYLGYTKDQYWKLYNEVNNKLDKTDKCTHEIAACDMICYIALADKYGLTKADIMKINFANYKIAAKFAETHRDINKEKRHWMNDLYLADGDDFRPGEYEGIDKLPGIWKWLKGQELLDYYKEELKKIPIKDFEWKYNVGDYRPCHNYKLNIKHHGKPTIHMFTWGLPGIMFRDGDIIVTDQDYYGRHVNLRYSSPVDVDEKLYNYCIKNLK